MGEKNTSDLYQELMEQPDLEHYIQENQPQFLHCDLSQLLSALYHKKSISKADLARRANISEVYLHQVFSGRRSPTRDRLLCICIALEATVDETQQLLKQAGYAQLYLKRKRDVVISHGLLHHHSFHQINDMLCAQHEAPLL